MLFQDEATERNPAISGSNRKRAEEESENNIGAVPARLSRKMRDPPCVAWATLRRNIAIP